MTELSDQGRPPGVLETLRQGPFRAYLLANLVSSTGKWMQRVAIGWLVWQLSGSETMLGMIGAAELVPAIVLGPIAGVLADRYRPLTIVWIASALGTVLAVALALSVMTGFGGIPLIFALMLASGVGNGTMEPARASLVYSLVSKRCLAGSVALDSLVYNVARLAGPALAGVLLLAWEPQILVLLNAASFVPMLGVLLWLRRHDGRAADREAPRSAGQGRLWAQIKAGLLYVVRDPRIGPIVLLLAGMSVCLRPVTDLLPAIVDRYHDGGPGELAFLAAGLGVGTLGTGLTITFVGLRGRQEYWLFGAAVMGMAGTLGLLHAADLALSFGMAILAGGALSGLGISAKTIMQTSCDPQYRGRVMSAYAMLFLGGPAIGLPLIGALAEVAGLRLAFEVVLLVDAALLVFVVLRVRRTARRARAAAP
jgi:MFS family permease